MNFAPLSDTTFKLYSTEAGREEGPIHLLHSMYRAFFAAFLGPDLPQFS